MMRRTAIRSAAIAAIVVAFAAVAAGAKSQQPGRSGDDWYQGVGGLGGPSGFGAGGGFPGVAGEPVVSVVAEFTAPAEGKPSRLFVKATIKPNWHIYSITQAAGGPIKTTITVAPSNLYQLDGEFKALTPPKEESQEVYPGLVVESHYNEAIWFAPIKLAPGVNPANIMVEGLVRAQPCDAGTCLPPQNFPFNAGLGPGEAIPEQAIAEAPAAEPVNWLALTGILLGAFVGGLLLNFMPCVLPAISLKLLAFFEQGGQSRARIFFLNVCFVVGLLVVFWVLASVSAFPQVFVDSDEFGWGEQFTFTWFKVGLTALVFIMALSFLGVWEIPIPGFLGRGKAGEMAGQEGPGGAFAKGIFTTLLGTPCIGPFLGPVFGFTISQPPWVTYLIFTSVGLGMGTPYLIIGAIPALYRFLPKPGAWMETVKQVMAFLLLGTVVYLFSTMNERYFIPTLALLVALWFMCWLIGRTPVTATFAARFGAWAGGAALAALIGVLAFTLLLRDLTLDWQPFSRQALAQARAEGKTVMVDFTADWCPNCKWNMHVAIDTKNVKKRVDQYEVVPMVADWTDRSPIIKDVLENDLNRKSIPVLAIWPAGKPDGDVIILDGTLTESQVLEALERAGPSQEALPEHTTAMRPR